MMLTDEHIDAIQALLRQGWCKHVSARDAAGNEVASTAREAVAWCLMGAAQRVGCARTFRRKWYDTWRGSLCISFNDQARSVDQVLAKLDEMRPK